MAAASALSLSAAATPANQWRYAQTKDAMSDSVRARVSVIGSGAIFVIKCDEPGRDSLYLQFIADHDLTKKGESSEDRDFEWRLDNRDAELSQWSYKDNQALTDDVNIVGHILTRLRTARRLRIRTHDSEGLEADWSMNVTGAAAAIAQVAKACRAEIADVND